MSSRISARIRLRRRAALGAALGLWAWTFGGPARANEPAARSYAVLSEMARSISVIVAQSEIGTRLPANEVDRVAIPDGVLDKAAILLARQSIQRAEPRAPVWLIAPLGEDLFPAFDKPFVGAKLALAADLADALRQRGSTHLVLVTPQRAEARFQFHNAQAGTGTLSGLGFYVDNNQDVRDRGSAVSALGYIAAFASFRVSIVETAGARLAASKAVYKHRVQTVAANSDTAVRHAWDSMTSERKVNTLRVLMEQGIDEAIREMLPSL